MPNYIRFTFFFALSSFLSSISYAACTQTLNPGANVATTVSSAAAGSTICLNSGSYGAVTLNNVVKTNDVILQSTSGVGASISLAVTGGSNHLKFQNLTINGMTISGSTTKNITIAGSVFTSQLIVIATNFNNNNILIDGNTLNGINSNGGYEGRITITWPNGPGNVSSGIVVTNNRFGKLGCTDGVQIGAYGVVVGPGNIFEDSDQGSCTEHVDSIQLYGQSHTTITGNYFYNNHVCIGAYDNGNSDVVTHNVFVAGTGTRNCIIDFGTSTNLTFSHNTVINASTRIGAINNAQGSSGSITNNIFSKSSFGMPGAGFSGTISHNMFANGAGVVGTNSLNGALSFVGGTAPNMLSGYQLTPNSLGYKSGSDGEDRGTNYYGNGSTTPPVNEPDPIDTVAPLLSGGSPSASWPRELKTQV